MAPSEASWREMVGLGRLELPTSRLSSARSNQLSYKPEPLPLTGHGGGHLRPSHVTGKGRHKTARARPGRKRNEGGEVPQMVYLRTWRVSAIRDDRIF
jgi:hypothetical protein